jgi:hypothetical protein
VARTRLRPAVRAVVGIALALVVLGVFVRLTGGRAVLASLFRADERVVAVGCVAGLCAVLAWSESLRHALSGNRPVGGLRYRLAYLSGDFAKQVLPMGRLSGGAILAYAVTRPFDFEYEEGLAAMTVTDLLNLVLAVVLSAAGLLVVVVRAEPGDVWTFVGGLAGAVVVAAGVVVLVMRRRDLIERVVLAVTTAVYRVASRLGVDAVAHRVDPDLTERRVEGYFRALDTVADDRWRVVATGAFAGVGWVGYAASLTAAAAALGAGVPFAVAMFVAPVSGLVGWSPLPGGSGGIEVAVTAGLVATAGLPVDLAAAVALLYRVCSYWFVVGVDAVATGVLAGLSGN